MTVLAAVALCALASARVTRFLVADDLLDAQRRWLLARYPPTGQPRTDTAPAIPAGQVPAWRHKAGDLASCSYCLGWWSSGGMLAVFHLVGLAAWPLRWDLGLWWAVAAVQMLVNAADARL